MKLDREARLLESKELTRRAGILVDSGELLKAQGLLERARILWPYNDEAERLLNEVSILRAKASRYETLYNERVRASGEVELVMASMRLDTQRNR